MSKEWCLTVSESEGKKIDVAEHFAIFSVISTPSPLISMYSIILWKKRWDSATERVKKSQYIDSGVCGNYSLE